MQKNQQPPDLVHKGNCTNSNANTNVPTTGEKMYLISRLNNYYSNILDHVVVSNDQGIATTHGGANSANLETMFNTSNNYPSNNCANLVSSLRRSGNTSVPSVATASATASTSTTTGQSDDDDENNEPDYAEPMIPDFPVMFTPERKPPLPPSCPPPPSNRSRYNDSRVKTTNIVA